jgi:nuclear transport factor 2 (NTF2) superfamily protein
MIALLPELIAVWPERTIVQQTFSSYADALVSQNFEAAYRYQSPEFQERITFDSFVQYERDAQSKFGILKSVQQEGMSVRKWRNPSRWRASIIADFQYERAVVRFTFELHRDNGRWTIFSSKGQEQ